MSKQSDRKKRELAKSRALAKSLKNQKNTQDQGSNPDASPKHPTQQIEQVQLSSNRVAIYENVAILLLLGTILLGLAAYIQIYNHIISIGILFLALGIYGQLIRIELIKHGFAVNISNRVFLIFSMSLMGCIILATCFPVKEPTNEPPDIRAPTIYPKHVQLHDGEWPLNTPVTISNPNSIPIFGVEVDVMIVGKGVTAASIITPQDFQTMPGNPTPPAIMCFTTADGQQGATITIDEIPANGSRTLRFQGTVQIKSSADLSIGNYKTTGEVQFSPGGPDLTIGGTPAHPPAETPPESALAVYPYASPVKQQPFETDFVLENKGQYAIKEITCDFNVKKVDMPNGSIADLDLFGGIHVKELHAGQQTTLHYANGHGPWFGYPINFAEMEITVNFCDERDPQKQLTRKFDFFTKRQENGEMKWYPVGE